MFRKSVLFVVAVAASFIVPALPAAASTTSVASVSTTIGMTNVTPMWGPQLPKIVHDAPSGWYYAATMDGSGTQHPWNARIWKSSNGTSWSLVKTLNAHVYQPPALTLDSGNRLWLSVPCYTGGECYPGVSSASGAVGERVYLVRLQFSAKLGDGSFNFSSWSDQSVRTAGAERYYGGIAIDADRRFMYHAYSKAGWGLYVSKFDTWNNSESTALAGSPGASEAYLYPRVRPGTSSGEVWLLFNQTTLDTGNSATIHGVQLWRSTDGGATFPANQRFMVASCPNPDGVNNWCDAADLVIDSSDAPHVLFYKRTTGADHLYYWKGTAGSVTLPGSPVDLGSYENHSQIVLGASGERFVFAADSVLRVLRSTNGTSWTSETFPISGADAVYSPNLMRKESGSFHADSSEVFRMLASSRPSGSGVYSRLDRVTYTAT